MPDWARALVKKFVKQSLMTEETKKKASMFLEASMFQNKGNHYANLFCTGLTLPLIRYRFWSLPFKKESDKVG